MITLKQVLSVLLVFLTIISVNQWSSLPIGSTLSSWILFTLILIILISSKKVYYDISQREQLIYVKIYIFWVSLCIIRGFFVAEFYWDYKSLINFGFALLLVISVYVFTNPNVVQSVLKVWLKIALPLFILFFFLLSPDSYGFYLVPLSFIAIFLPTLSPGWRLLVFGIAIMVILFDLDARSNVIKFTIPFFLSLLYFFKNLVRSKIFKIIHLGFFILPFIFLILGIFNVFNIFKMDEYISGNFTETKIINGEKKKISLTADTRTFLYQEVILSAINNNYVVFGRTPARGNDSEAFGEHTAEELKTGRHERYSNEVSILNIFTWTGLVGVILYFLIFFKAAQLAIYKSNNDYIKIIGMYVSFRWSYAWVEDFNRFDIMNVLLWITIAICYSTFFRSMNNDEMKYWIKGIFSKKYRSYNKFSSYI